MLIAFVWAGKPPRVAKRILYLPLSGGGLALPNFQTYYWAAIFVTVRWWFSQLRQNPAVTLVAATLGSYAAFSNLVFRGKRACPSMTAPMWTTLKVWQESRIVYKKPFHISSHMPLWTNPMLPHFQTLPDLSLCAGKGILIIKHITMTFPELRALYSIPKSWEFRYWQLRYAYGAQFPEKVTLESDSLERLLTSSTMGRPLSSLYMYLTAAYDIKPTRFLDKWKKDIPALDDEVLEDCVATFIPSMIAAKDRFIQLKFIHRAYYTPQRLARFFPHRNPLCPRCRLEEGSFWHMVWPCPKLHPYWQAVADTLTELTDSA